MASIHLPYIVPNANQSSSKRIRPRKCHHRLLPTSSFLTLTSGAKGSISTALGTRSDRRTSGRRRRSLDPTIGHRYFLRSSVKKKPPTCAASNDPPRSPLSTQYRPLELAKMPQEAREKLWEEKWIAAEDASAHKVAEGTHLHPLCFLSLFLVSLVLTTLLPD